MCRKKHIKNVLSQNLPAFFAEVLTTCHGVVKRRQTPPAPHRGGVQRLPQLNDTQIQ